MKTYRIRPLKWTKMYDETRQEFGTDTIFGSMSVWRRRENYESDGEWGTWHWKYCFDEYYEEGEQDCASLKAGKAAATEYYLNKLMGALKEV